MQQLQDPLTQGAKKGMEQIRNMDKDGDSKGSSATPSGGRFGSTPYLVAAAFMLAMLLGNLDA